MLNVYEQVGRNKRRSAVIIIIFGVFIAGLTYILGRVFGYGPSFIGFALIFSGLLSFGGYWYSDKIILLISRAKLASKKENYLFYSVCENLSLAADIPMPKLYVIDDLAPNAFATGRDIKHAVVCATTGLLEKLDRTELEGVIGHELSHIRNYDMRLASVVTVLVGMVTLLADWMLRARFRRRDEREEGNLGAIFMVVGIVLALLSPLIAQLIQLALSRRRELLADAGSVMLTRQPGGLIRALQKISSDKEPLQAANKATAHLYIVNPLKENIVHPEPLGPARDKLRRRSWFTNLFNTHPPIEERIKALKEME